MTGMGRGSGYRADLNENPFAPLSSVLVNVQQAAATLNRYPDGRCASLLGPLAEQLDVPEDHLVIGAGSTAILQQLLLAKARNGVVMYSRPSDRYAALSRIVNARAIEVPLRGADQDLGALLEAITDETALVFLGNPCDPTGTAVQRSELDAFLRQVPENVLVVIDEEYREFVRDPGVPDGIELCREWSNVAVVRSFSKAYGLAGLRIGFGVAQPPIAESIRAAALPLSVTAMAEAAALASLGEREEILERSGSLIRERDRLRRGLRSQGWEIPASEANFVWLPLTGEADEFSKECAAHGVFVRGYSGQGVRITVGEPEANDLVLFVASWFGPA